MKVKEKSESKKDSRDAPKESKKRKNESKTETDNKEKENKPEVEDSKTESEKTKPKNPYRKREKGLYKRIAEVLEFYFSDANLRRDGYLSKLIKEDPWVPLSEFNKFNKAKSMVGELISERTFEAHLIKALQVKKSTMLEVSEDQTKVKRVTPLSDKENPESCTIYVENIAPDSTPETLQYLFKPFGTAVYVSIPKFLESKKTKGYAFIEFENETSVAEIMKACGGTMNPDIKNISVSDKELLSIKAYKQEHEQSSEEQSSEVKDGENGANNLPPSPKRLKLDDKPAGEELPSENQTNSVDIEANIEMGSLLGLRILTKQQWRRLRNQYLNSQKRNITMAKKQLRQASGSSAYHQHQRAQENSSQSNQNSQNSATNASKQENNSQSNQNSQNSATNAPKQDNVKFESGVIVKISVEEQIGELKVLKKKVKELDPNVAYVDVKIGQTDFFVRCKTVEDCDKFCTNKVDGWHISKLEGEEEKDYWKVIAKDMLDKKSGNVKVPKKKKKAVLFRKLEEHRNSHMFFPD